MTRERLYLYDTTLRDGQQTQGVQFSLAEKQAIAASLDAIGIDYIEGGWPGANPTDSDFFNARPQTRARFTAFGMTKRAGRSAENDDVLAQVMNAGTPAVCLVGKSMNSTSKPRWGFRWRRMSRTSGPPLPISPRRAARRCLMRSISLMGIARIPSMRSRASMRPILRARVGLCSAIPMAALCQRRLARWCAR